MPPPASWLSLSCVTPWLQAKTTSFASHQVALFLSFGWLTAVLGVLAGLAFLLISWSLLGPGPRRQRAYRRARRLFQQRSWKEALATIHEWGDRGRLPPLWQGRFRNLEGESNRLAGDLALQEGRYEDAVEHYALAADLLSINSNALRSRVLEAILSEVRKRFAESGKSPDQAPVHALIARLFRLHSPCGEASFWEGLCHVRAGHTDRALASLAAAESQAGKEFLDPGLYLGALLLREGRPQEALRHLSEANRVDRGCPLVTWQVGMAMLAAGGDSSVAARALARAVGPQGLARWLKNPGRLWVEALPEGQSYVQRMAKEHGYSCRVFGNDVGSMIRQGQFALAEAHSRQGHYQDAASVFARILQDSPPSALLLRGLGIALARLERYDEAYKHLRLAVEQEESKDSLTAGYLALCAALGKPSRPEDKPKNLQWAIRLLARHDMPGDIEWARISSRVFADARALELPLALEDQQRLIATLHSVHAADPLAAAALAHLAATHPESLRPADAWLYCRAAQQHGVESDQDLLLFATAFRDSAGMQTFFIRQAWNFDEVIFTYLERWSAQHSGEYPPELSEDFRSEAECRLLERSRKQADAGKLDRALATGRVLLRLAPTNPRAHDWLARLHDQAGDYREAVTLLRGWHALHPCDPLPLLRLAIVEHHASNAAGRRDALAGALARTTGSLRARIGLLGVRMLLDAAWQPSSAGPERNGSMATEQSAAYLRTGSLHEAASLLQDCLNDDPGCPEALWQLAAVYSTVGDLHNLAELSPAMDRPDVADARFQYLAAVCHLAAGKYSQVLEACARAGRDTALAIECEYLRGWAHLRMNDWPAARVALRKVADQALSPSADLARGLLGRLYFAEEAYEDVVQTWRQVPAPKRTLWGLDEALRKTVLLTGLLSYQRGRYAEAAEQFGECGRLGADDAPLSPLTAAALVRASQRLLLDPN